jgi:hypothetical protein
MPQTVNNLVSHLFSEQFIFLVKQFDKTHEAGSVSNFREMDRLFKTTLDITGTGCSGIEQQALTCAELDVVGVHLM